VRMPTWGSSRLATAPPPGLRPGAPPQARAGALKLVKPPAHRDPQHVFRLPLPGMDLTAVSVGQAWTCDTIRSTGCGKVWTWTGEGWAPYHLPAGFAARHKMASAWLSSLRDVTIQPVAYPGALRKPPQVHNDLHRRQAVPGTSSRSAR
jgi:hypothetical protein